MPGGKLGGLCTGEPKCLRKPVSGDAGCGSLGPAGTKLKHEPKTSLPCGGLILGSAAPSRVKNGFAAPIVRGPPPELNPLPPRASCAVASPEAHLLARAFPPVSCRKY